MAPACQASCPGTGNAAVNARRLTSWLNARSSGVFNTYGVTMSQRTGRCFACPTVWEPREDGTTDWAIYGLTKQMRVPGGGQYAPGAIFALCTECTVLAGTATSIHDWIAIVSRSPAAVGPSQAHIIRAALAAMRIFEEAVRLRPDQLDAFMHTFVQIEGDAAAATPPAGARLTIPNGEPAPRDSSRWS